jgi:hypothetical protein
LADTIAQSAARWIYSFLMAKVEMEIGLPTCSSSR